MTVENQPEVPSGSEPIPASGEVGKKDYVSHDSYVKAVGEAKRAKQKLAEATSRLAEFDEQVRLQKESKLLEEKNFTELLGQKNAEIERLANENNSHIKDKLDYRKMNAALGLLQQKGINIDPKYMGLLSLDNILISEESGEVVSDTVVSVVEGFQREHPRLVAPIGNLLPNLKSGQGQPKLSVDEWKKLSPEDKRKALSEKRVNHPGLS